MSTKELFFICYHQSMKSSYLASLPKRFQWSHSKKRLDKAMRDNIQQHIMGKEFSIFLKNISYMNIFQKRGSKSLKLYKVV